MNKSILQYNYEDAWLGLGDDATRKLRDIISVNHNPLYIEDDIFKTVGLRELLALSNLKYIGYTSKILFGIDLPPFQMIIQQQLATKSFPMLIGTRAIGKSFSLGLSAVIKCLFNPGTTIVFAGAAFRQSKSVFEYSEKIVKESPIITNMVKFDTSRQVDSWTMYLGSSKIIAIPIGCLSPESMVCTNRGFMSMDELKSVENIKDYKVWSNGKWSNICYFYNSGISECWEVKTKKGYSYKGTPNHKMKIVRDNKIVWSRTDGLKIGDRILIDRTPRWHNSDVEEVSIDDAYAAGLMVGDGQYNKKYHLRFTSLDKELQDAVKVIGDFKMHNDGIHSVLCGKKIVKEWLDLWGLEPKKRADKTIGRTILKCSKEKVVAFIQGLFDSDGHVSILSKNKEPSGVIGFTNTSKEVCTKLQFLLSHFGIISTLNCRQRENKNSNIIYEVFIHSKNIEIFYKEIGFRLPRKQKVLKEFIENRKRRCSTKDNIPIDLSLLPKRVIKDRKTLTFDRAIKCNFEHELVNENYFYDEVISIEKQIDQPMYDINVPDGNEYTGNCFFSHNSGQKIRGMRATDVYIDEYASHNPEIVDEVITGFAAIGVDPVKSYQHAAAVSAAKRLGLDYQKLNQTYQHKKNCILLSGTAEYYFNHFYSAWKKYCAIIKAGNNEKLLNEIFKGEIPNNHNPNDYCVMRLPYKALPPKYMAEEIVARAKAQMPRSLYLKEYEAVFVEDSDGFFSRKTIESCVASPKNIEDGKIPQYCGTAFEGKMRGDSNGVYVFGIDPAAKNDNFAVVVLEVYPEHSRVVHCWTTNEKDFAKKKIEGHTNETDYYAYCVRKIRDLISMFPTRLIGIDAQGGGFAIQEAFKKADGLLPNEKPIYEVIDYDKPKPTDDLDGDHFLFMVEFAKASWLHDANWGLRGDLESKTLLFPYYDTVSGDISIAIDKARAQEFEEKNPGKTLIIHDSLEDVLQNIEDLKDELTNVVHTQTNTGREKWDVPDIKIDRHTKGSGKKDRYSALLIANYLARNARKNIEKHTPYQTYGGYVKDIKAPDGSDNKLYSGPSWFVNKIGV